MEKEIGLRSYGRSQIYDTRYFRTTNLLKWKRQHGRISSKCPRCGERLEIRTGRYGEFYGCLNYPNCRYTKNIMS